jgi:hypothetical protein
VVPLVHLLLYKLHVSTITKTGWSHQRTLRILQFLKLVHVPESVPSRAHGEMRLDNQ